jgi:4-amino-4-deoxy-L-arabinose transferase-like glycosyltransferase
MERRLLDALSSAWRVRCRLRPAVLALGIIAAIGLVVRLWGLTFGLPLVRSRPDELLIIGVVMNVLGRDPNPRFFDYPALYLYVLAGLYSLYYATLLLLGKVSGPADLVANFRQHWEPYFLIGRTLSAVLGSATVLVTHGIAARLFGVPTGLLAALFTALAFLHVRDSHYGTTDIPMTFFVTCAMLALVRAHTERRTSDARLAGLLAGCAAATKYTALLLAAPMFVAVVVHAWSQRSDWRRTLRETHLAWMFVPFGAIFLAANPFIVLDSQRAVHDLSTLYHSTADGMTPPDLLGPGWTHHLLVSLRYGLGWPLVVASLVGLCWMFYRAPGSAAILAAFPVACYVASGPAHNVFVRYMVPVVPFLCIFAAFFVSEVGRLAAIRVGRAQPALVAALAVVLVAPSAASVVRFDALLTQMDSRLIAAQWVRDHVETGSAIYMAGSHYGHPLLERHTLGGFQGATRPRR